MRTQFFFVGLLSVFAGGLVGTAGCDDITAGQSSDTAAPPQLVHVHGSGRTLSAWPSRTVPRRSTFSTTTGRTPSPRASPATSINPCINEFLVDQVAPDVSLPAVGHLQRPAQDPGDRRAGSAIGRSRRRAPMTCATRAAASRSASCSTRCSTRASRRSRWTRPRPRARPTSLRPQRGHRRARRPGRHAGPERRSTSTTAARRVYSSDLELVPLGPAIVIKPKASLDAASTYTVKILNPGADQGSPGQRGRSASVAARSAPRSRSRPRT